MLKNLFKWNDLWAMLALSAWFLMYHLPVTLAQRVFSEGDILWGNLPIRAEVTRALMLGKLPLWTPLLQGGMPLFAEGHTAALYPLNPLLHFFLAPHFAISYIILFNLGWVALGMYAFARALGLRVSSSILAGLTFGASGALIARVSHLDVHTPISWLPWLMFFQVRYWRARAEGRRARGWFALGCLSIGVQFLAGSPAVIALNLIAYGACGLFASVLWRASPTASRTEFFKTWSRRLVETLLVTFGSVILGIGIGAAQLLPTAELIGWSIRGKELGIQFFTSYSLDPAALSQFIAPFAFFNEPSAENMEFWGYFGILPLFLAFAAPMLRRDFRAWFFALFAALVIGIALGGSTPLHLLLYQIPILNRFRVPARYLFLFLFAMTTLAAIGLDEIQNRLRDDRGKNSARAILRAAILAAVIGVMFSAYDQSLDSWLSAWKWLPIVFVGASIALFIFARRTNRQVFQTLALGLTCLDLACFGAPFLSTLARTSPPAELVQVPRPALAMDHREPIARALVMQFPSVTQAAIRATMWSGLPMAYGRAGILTGYMPFSLALQRNEEYIQAMNVPMRNLLNIRYYLLPLEIAPPETDSPLNETQPADGLTLELLRARPVIAPTRASSVRVVSYTDQTTELPDGFLAGEIDLTFADGTHRVLPLRLGIETADWAYDGIASRARVHHSQPRDALTFPAYLRSVGRDFTGKKFVARFDVASTIRAIGARAFLPGAGLTIEHIDLMDDAGNAISLASLLHRADFALAFRSHTAAMWDNRDAMPRAFVVYRAETLTDAETLARMQSSEFEPAQIVFVNDAPSANLISNSPGDYRVEVIEYQSDRAVFQVATDRAGYFVLADAWYPGWRAFVDAVETPIWRADYMFRALPLSPGVHRLEFTYQPASFAWGVLISGVVLAILGIGTMIGCVLQPIDKRVHPA
jgi:hypothetical protein